MTISKKTFLGYALGAIVTLLVAAPLVLGFANNASAQALGKDQFFGGGTGSDTTFATDAGLQGGNLVDTIEAVIKTLLGFLGIVAVIMIMLGGFKWMTSQGDDKKVGDAKKLIYAGIIGLIIVIAAFAIATFVIEKFLAALSPTAGGG